MAHATEVIQLQSQLQASGWVSLEEFYKSPTRVCFIKYKGLIKPARLTGNPQSYKFKYLDTDSVWMSECISAVMPITPPTE